MDFCCVCVCVCVCVCALIPVLVMTFLQGTTYRDKDKSISMLAGKHCQCVDGGYK